MDTTQHNLESLFEQLGLDNSQEAIDRFISAHKPLPPDQPLPAADFWTPSQAGFLREALDEDADWAEIVDHLDAMLRG